MRVSRNVLALGTDHYAVESSGEGIIFIILANRCCYCHPNKHQGFSSLLARYTHTNSETSSMHTNH